MPPRPPPHSAAAEHLYAATHGRYPRTAAAPSPARQYRRPARRDVLPPNKARAKAAATRTRTARSKRLAAIAQAITSTAARPEPLAFTLGVPL